MSRTTITLEIDACFESLLRDYAAFLDEMKDLAATAPDGAVLDTCEKAVVQQGREHQRRVLQEAVQSRVQDAEKKGRR
jgi:hypothetical protein